MQKVHTLNGQYADNRKGITLIELLIVLALLSVILAVGFSFLFFGNRSFKLSEEKADHQYDVRMPVDFISKAVRYADTVQILSGVPTAAANQYDIYLDAGQIKYNENGTADQIYGTAGVSDYTFEVRRISNDTLEYTIGKTGTTKYDVTTQVVILNIPQAGSIAGTSPGIGIRFTKNAVIP